MTQKQLFLQCAENAGIKLESNFIVRVDEYTKVKKLFQLISSNNIQLGTDITSGTCSGDVVISSFADHHILFEEKDNGSSDCFKFSSLLFICNDLTDESSAPEMIFEAAQDTEWLSSYADNACIDGCPEDGIYIGLQFKETNKIIYDRIPVKKILELEDASRHNDSDDVIIPKTTHIYRNTKSGIIAYVNLQCCQNRHDGNQLIYDLKNCSMDQLVKCLQQG